MRAQELVDGGELGADLGGLAAGALDARVDLAAGAAGGVRGGVGRAPRLPHPVGLGGQPLELRRGGRAARLELLEVARQPLVAVLGELLELGLHARDALGGAGIVALVLARLGLEPGEQGAAALRAVLDRGHGGAGGLEPQLDPLGGGARGVGAVGQRLAVGPARRQGALGLLARRAQPGQLGLDRAVGLARGPDLVHGGAELRARAPRVLARQRPARLVGLALEPLVQLGRLGLALQRPQPRPRLALDVQRAVEIVLGAARA